MLESLLISISALIIKFAKFLWFLPLPAWLTAGAGFIVGHWFTIRDVNKTRKIEKMYEANNLISELLIDIDTLLRYYKGETIYINGSAEMQSTMLHESNLCNLN